MILAILLLFVSIPVAIRFTGEKVSCEHEDNFDLHSSLSP